MFNKYRLHILSTAAGAVSGYFLFHPYSMFVFYIIRASAGSETHVNWGVIANVLLLSFKPAAFPMAFAFTFFGGIIGLLAGVMVNRKRNLDAIAHENEKKKVAIETLHRLMVTLSHYLLNANTVIGGEVRHSQKIETSGDVLASLEIIREQAARIDSVIRALRKATDIKTANYTSEGHGMMMDIAREVEEEILNQKKNSAQDNH